LEVVLLSLQRKNVKPTTMRPTITAAIAAKKVKRTVFSPPEAAVLELRHLTIETRPASSVRQPSDVSLTRAAMEAALFRFVQPAR